VGRWTVGRWTVRRCGGAMMVDALAPRAEKLHLVSHFVGRLGRHEPEQSPHLFTHRQTLPRQDNAGVGATCAQPGCVEAKKVTSIKRINHSRIRRGPFQLFFVGLLRHPGLDCGDHVCASTPQLARQRMPSGILVEVKANPHASRCLSLRCACSSRSDSVSSAAMCASISTRLAW
jgi:hypothetical protein